MSAGEVVVWCVAIICATFLITVLIAARVKIKTASKLEDE